MRIRLARKIQKHPRRYSRGKLNNALVRLGWRTMRWHLMNIPPLTRQDWIDMDRSVLTNVRVRVVEVMPKECWSTTPIVFEDE